MADDVSFDGISRAFEADIYASSKGLIRLSVLSQQLLDFVPTLQDGGLTILDAGGGSGHLAVRLARMGHRVTLCDLSEEMIGLARARAAQAGVSHRIEFHCGAIQDFVAPAPGTFDLLICHAVLEWVSDPRDVLRALRRLLHGGGYLSVMFYNRNAALLKQALKGDFEKALAASVGEQSYQGWGRGVNPLDNDAVAVWLEESDFNVVEKAAVRVLHDHIDEEKRGPTRLHSLLALEQHLSRVEPFVSLGQHTHILARAR